MDKRTRQKYDLRRADWDKLREVVEMPTIVEGGDNINQKTKDLTWALQEAMRRAIPIQKEYKKLGNRPWNDRQQRIRRETRKARRRYQRCDDPVDRNVLLTIYRNKTDEYETSIVAVRKDSWEEFVKGELATNPRGIPYKTASGKIRPPLPLSTLRRSNRTCWQDTIELLMEALLSDDQLEGETLQQIELRRLLDVDSSTPDLGQLVVGNTGWLEGLGRHRPRDLIVAQGQLCGQIQVVTWSDKTRPSTCWDEASK
ncbi:unnamed protein product [Timema podura]|uniref:Reverse transcriptase N-terminal domain-containing protein n=1 Tax=Timema podura TaxID=61482 RepID=A0ABN7NPF0_TIMPD|nr:unnamed protein product [Timema podura]